MPRFDLDRSERLALVGEGHDLVAARFEHAGDDQAVVRLGSTNAMRIRGLLLPNCNQGIPLKLN
jgi:hypothetical protein